MEKAPPFRTLVPARLDRLPWSPFHWKVVIALGITWLIDGLEVTLIGSISGVLHDRATLHFSAGELGTIGSFYLIGAVVGALVFGHLTDLLGRKKLFFVTLAVYLSGTLLTAFSWDIWTFIFFFASCAASSAYLTVSEIFPLEIRALAIALFYSIDTAVGGVVAPWPFGVLIGTGSRLNVTYGYIVASILMIVAAVIEAVYGVKAERAPLEQVAEPLSTTA
jgi:MFS family permease